MTGERFVLIGDVPRPALLESARRLERLRSVLGQISPGSDFGSPLPTTVYVFSEADRFEAFSPAASRREGAAGYLVPGEDGVYAALSAEGIADPVASVLKQYVQYLLHLNRPGLPLWLRQGVAELYSTFEVDERETRIGRAVEPYVHALRPLEAMWTPAALVLASRGDRTPDDIPVTYFAECWAIVHYLILGEGDRRPLFGDLVERLAAGEEGAAALRETYGLSPEELDGRVRDYVRQDYFRFFRVPVEIGAEPATLIAPLDAAALDAALGDLLLHVAPAERRAEARTLFDRALAANPAEPLALRARGEAEELGGDLEGAIADYRSAVAADPLDFRARNLLGTALLASLGGRRLADDAARARLEEARKTLRQATDLRADYAPAWAQLGYSETFAEEPSDEGVLALERASRSLPGRSDILFNLILAHAHRADRAAAEAAVARLERLRPGEALVARARETLVQIDYREANRLLRERAHDDAVGLLARVAAESSDAVLREKAGAQLAAARRAPAHDRFVRLHDAALAALQAGDRTAAEARLDELQSAARPGRQAERVAELRARLEGLGPAGP